MSITNSIIATYIDTLYSGGNPQLNELREFAEKNHVPIIQKSTEKLLLSLLKIKQPELLLEIGTAVGYSACLFADGCGCNVVTIESDRETYDIAVNNIRNLGFEDKVTAVYGDAREIIYTLQSEPQKIAGIDRASISFDAVFVDAAKSHYKEFWDLSIPLCNDGALVLCDNVLMKGMTASDQFDTRKRYKTSIRKMREFITYINNLPYAETSVMAVGDGVSISLIEGASERIGD